MKKKREREILLKLKLTSEYRQNRLCSITMFPLKSSPRNPRHDTNNTGHQGLLGGLRGWRTKPARSSA